MYGNKVRRTEEIIIEVKKYKERNMICYRHDISLEKK